LDELQELLRNGAILDSRPMFNGEYRSFIKILQLKESLDSFLSIGAREDNFYLDLMPHKRCVLVEPDIQAAAALDTYIKQWAMPNKSIDSSCIYQAGGAQIPIYSNGSIFRCRPIDEMTNALESGLVICPYTKAAIATGLYSRGDVQIIADSISLLQLLEKHNINPEFVKIDVEGAEKDLIESLMSANVKPSFIQYEYGATWFHAGHTMNSLFQVTNDYYHYIITPKQMILLDKPPQKYFYANFLASRRFLGQIIAL